MGYRPFIDSPLDIDMIDSMILWIRIMFVLCYCIEYTISKLANLTKGKYWKKVLKCV
jgi:hypothetical protein